MMTNAEIVKAIPAPAAKKIRGPITLALYNNINATAASISPKQEIARSNMIKE